MPLKNAPWEPRIEHLEQPEYRPLGLTAPRLSWKLPDAVIRQEAYQIEINGEPGPRIVSDTCALVPRPGQPVASR